MIYIKKHCVFEPLRIYVSIVEEQSLPSRYEVGAQPAVAAAAQQRDRQVLLNSKYSGHMRSCPYGWLTKTAYLYVNVRASLLFK